MKSCRSLLEIVRNGLFDIWVLVGSRRERLNSFLYFLLLGEGSSFMMQNLDWPITACSYPLSLTHGAGRPSTWWLQLWCKTVSIISFSCHLLSESSLKSNLRKAKWGTCLFCLPQIFLLSFSSFVGRWLERWRTNVSLHTHCSICDWSSLWAIEVASLCLQEEGECGCGGFVHCTHIGYGHSCPWPTKCCQASPGNQPQHQCQTHII